MFSTHPALTKLSDRHVHMCFSLLWQTGQLWVYILKPWSSVYTILCLSDGLTDDRQRNQYDDGTSTASKLCVTVLFLQYFEPRVRGFSVFMKANIMTDLSLTSTHTSQAI